MYQVYSLPASAPLAVTLQAGLACLKSAACDQVRQLGMCDGFRLLKAAFKSSLPQQRIPPHVSSLRPGPCLTHKRKHQHACAAAAAPAKARPWRPAPQAGPASAGYIGARTGGRRRGRTEVGEAPALGRHAPSCARCAARTLTRAILAHAVGGVWWETRVRCRPDAGVAGVDGLRTEAA